MQYYPHIFMNGIRYSVASLLPRGQSVKYQDWACYTIHACAINLWMILVIEAEANGFKGLLRARVQKMLISETEDLFTHLCRNTLNPNTTTSLHYCWNTTLQNTLFPFASLLHRLSNQTCAALFSSGDIVQPRRNSRSFHPSCCLASRIYANVK